MQKIGCQLPLNAKEEEEEEEASIWAHIWAASMGPHVSADQNS